MDYAPKPFVETESQSHILHEDRFTKGLLNLLALPNRTLLELHAVLENLHAALERNCVDVNYMGLEPAGNVMNFPRLRLSLRDGTEMIVPQL